MKIIAAYALLTVTSIGFMPSAGAARSLDASAIGVDSKIGNWRPGTVFRCDPVIRIAGIVTLVLLLSLDPVIPAHSPDKPCPKI